VKSNCKNSLAKVIGWQMSVGLYYIMQCNAIHIYLTSKTQVSKYILTFDPILLI